VYAGVLGATVLIFAPNASRKYPTATLTVGNDPWQLTVDSNGYLYVAADSASGFNGVQVFAPGASGVATPVAQIPRVGYTGRLAIDPLGNLYVANNTTGLTEYSAPTTSPKRVHRICYHSNHFNQVLVTRSTSYVLGDYPRRVRGRITEATAGVSSCPAQPRTFTEPTPGFGNVLGIVKEGAHLIAADRFYPGASGNPALVVLDADDLGAQVPIAVVSGAPLQSPRELALGP
jgi:hypothetical protein